MEYFVTTSDRATSDVVKSAEQLANSVGLPFNPRNRRSLAQLRLDATGGFFVLDNQRLLTYYGEPPFRFHPGMAQLRILNLSRGQQDRLMQFSGVEDGDAVLDCTAGLCSDAAVFSYCVGVSGKVIALESSFPIYLVTNMGFKNYPFAVRAQAQAFGRILLYHQSYQDFLSKAPAESFDIIYFDPMFERPIFSSSGLEPLRQVADYRLLEPTYIRKALHVARKGVVVKATDESSLWSDFPPDKFAESKGSPVVYGLYQK